LAKVEQVKHIAKIIAKISEPSSGKIFYKGEDVSSIPKQAYQGKVQMIFQDPYSTLNPMMRVRNIIKNLL